MRTIILTRQFHSWFLPCLTDHAGLSSLADPAERLPPDCDLAAVVLRSSACRPVDGVKSRFTSIV